MVGEVAVIGVMVVGEMAVIGVMVVGEVAVIGVIVVSDGGGWSSDVMVRWSGGDAGGGMWVVMTETPLKPH